MPHDLSGRRVTVMGLGRFGGGLGVTRWLLAQGCRVTVTDLADERALAPALRALEDDDGRARLDLRLGGHDERDFTGADLVVANPAVPTPWSNRWLVAAARASVPVTTEIRLLVERLDARRVVGVTGTAGKSTTSAMIDHGLRRLGARSRLGGNIGGSLLGALDAIADDEWIVLELSSAMLHWLDAGRGAPDAPGWSPGVAVLTNLAPNHTDWHGTVEHYYASKETIFRHPPAGAIALRGADVEDPGASAPPLAVPGAHNRRNAALAAAAIARCTGADPRETYAALADFPGLPHRLRLVRTAGARRFYDDSKSTVPEATVLAVESFEEPQRVHLVAGGYDKGIDLAPIIAIAPRLAGLYTIGATSPALANAENAHDCGTLELAVGCAMERMADGDSLLLSPGCASWDQFENYEARGRAFEAAIAKELEE